MLSNKQHRQDTITWHCKLHCSAMYHSQPLSPITPDVYLDDEPMSVTKQMSPRLQARAAGEGARGCAAAAAAGAAGVAGHAAAAPGHR